MKLEMAGQMESVPLVLGEQERLCALIEIVIQLESLNGVRSIPPFPLRRALTAYDEPGIVEMSALARAHFHAGELPILDLIALFESMGLRVISTSMDKSVSSFSVCLKSAGIFIFLNALETSERKIFSLAHELGSLIFGARGMDAELLRRVAVTFSACFLLPESPLRRSFLNFGFSEKNELSFEMLLNLKSRFGVSAEAFLKRVFQLKIISKKNHHALSEEVAVHYRKTNFQEPWLKGHLPQLSENVRLFNMVHLALSQKKIGKPEARGILEKFGW